MWYIIIPYHTCVQHNKYIHCSNIPTFRESDAILVVLTQVEVPAEPGLDTRVLTDYTDKLSCILRGVVEPAASVNDVILL